MSRRGTAEKRTAKSDPIFRNRLVNMVVNRIMKDGKKSLAYQILYRAVKKIQQKTETNPLLVLRQAIRRVTPNIGVKTRRNKKGSTRKVPIEIGSKQGRALAIRWLLEASQKRPGRNMAFKLSSELVDAAKGSGGAIRKKEATHRMAEANRALAHFRSSMNRIYVCRHMDPYISIGKESIEGESDDIFLETNKKEKKEKTEIMIN